MLYWIKIVIGVGDVLSEKLGDEVIWAVKNCTMADVCNFFKDPVCWVAKIPTGPFRLKHNFTVFFKLIEAQDHAKPPGYLISGIDNTAVVTITVAGGFPVTTPPEEVAAVDEIPAPVVERIELTDRLRAPRDDPSVMERPLPDASPMTPNRWISLSLNPR